MSRKDNARVSRKESSRGEKPVDDSRSRKEADGTERPRPVEIGGRRNGLEPTRYGDWEKEGRCIDF